MFTKVTIICRVHGEFHQKPVSHLNGAGCQQCSESRGERTIGQVLDSVGIVYEREKRFGECRDKHSLPFDFYLPDHGVCIEYHGVQHYESVDHFGGEEKFAGRVRRDKIKERYCQRNGIKLIVIPYWEDDIAGLLQAELQQVFFTGGNSDD